MDAHNTSEEHLVQLTRDRSNSIPQKQRQDKQILMVPNLMLKTYGSGNNTEILNSYKKLLYFYLMQINGVSLHVDSFMCSRNWNAVNKYGFLKKIQLIS